MKKTTREWVRKAEKDYRLIARIAAQPDPFHDQVCFFCQQSAEKYLKALLEELHIAVAKTHDLERLLVALSPHHASLRPLRRGLRVLSNFAVSPRYPGDNATKRQAISAQRWAGRVRDACRAILGLP